MLTNYSINNNQPSFGKYEFIHNSKEILQKSIKSDKDLAILKDIIQKEQEGVRANRTITIGRTFHNGSYSGNRFSANVGDGNWHTQGFFESALSFLKNMTKKADKFQNKQMKNKDISKTINNYLDNI